MAATTGSPTLLVGFVSVMPLVVVMMALLDSVPEKTALVVKTGYGSSRKAGPSPGLVRVQWGRDCSLPHCVTVELTVTDSERGLVWHSPMPMSR